MVASFGFFAVGNFGPKVVKPESAAAPSKAQQLQDWTNFDRAAMEGGYEHYYSAQIQDPKLLEYAFQRAFTDAKTILNLGYHKLAAVTSSSTSHERTETETYVEH